MKPEESKDYFLLLEEKIEILIKYIQSLKEEKKTLLEKVKTLTGELDHFREANNRAKDRMVSLLEKIDQLNV